MIESHDPLQCLKQLRQALAADKLSVGFFLGAGCPCAIRVPAEGSQDGNPLIPDINGLTAQVSVELSSSDSAKESFAGLMSVLQEDGYVDPTIEDVLSRVRALRDAAGTSEVRGLSADSLDELDSELCRSISEAVDVCLPDGSTPYHSLARLVGSYGAPPPEVFTTNYDLLMEQALESRRVPFFDGFIGSSCPFFDQQAIEEDAIPPRWRLLWKIHGSINWRFNKQTGEISRSRQSADGEELLIHPSHRKYDESRRMPYLIMMDRLKSFLRNDKKPVALFAVGHSFSDEHINATIVESLRANPSAVCFALQYGAVADYPAAEGLARNESNFLLLARDAAVVRGRRANWIARAATDPASLRGAFEFVDAGNDEGSAGLEVAGTDDGDEPRACRFLLGDFESFGKFVDEFSRSSVPSG